MSYLNKLKLMKERAGQRNTVGLRDEILEH